MKEKDVSSNQLENKNDFEGYPPYPASDDIYNKFHEEKDINPENMSKTINSNEIDSIYNGKELREDESYSGLDIPGSDLDDQQEMIGSEDEENNYYSIGGDNHNDLDEDKGH